MGGLRGGDIFIAFPLWMAAAAAATLVSGQIEAFAVLAPVALALRSARAGRVAMGWANALTWLRILVTSALVLLPSASLAMVVLAFAVFALDGADGALARRLGTSSEFGAELDMECDAFFVLMLGILLWNSGQTGLWVLIPGAWRYGYSIFVALAPELREAPRSNWARYSYSTSCLCLIAALWSGTPMPSAWAAVATLLISSSFLRSLYYSLPRSSQSKRMSLPLEK